MRELLIYYTKILTTIAMIIGVILVMYSCLDRDDPQPVPEIEIPEVIDHEEEIEETRDKIEEMKKKLDPDLIEKVDQILINEYENIEHCIDTIYVNGVPEYVWNGCK